MQLDHVQVAPMTLELAGCQFQIHRERGHDGSQLKALVFIHMTGALAFKVLLGEEACTELIRQLTGGIHVPTPGNGAG